MSDQADSAVEPGEATGELAGNPAGSDSTPDLDATGQEQGDQTAEKRLNGLMSLAQRRTAERDAAQAQIDDLKSQLAQYETQAVAETPGQTQQELLYPERFQSEPEADAVDPYAPPEPTPRIMETFPSRGQSVPFGATPSLGEPSSPSARYAQDQAEIAAMKQRLNAAGQQWLDEAK